MSNWDLLSILCVLYMAVRNNWPFSTPSALFSGWCAFRVNLTICFYSYVYRKRYVHVGKWCKIDTTFDPWGAVFSIEILLMANADSIPYSFKRKSEIRNIHSFWVLTFFCAGNILSSQHEFIFGNGLKWLSEFKKTSSFANICGIHELRILEIIIYFFFHCFVGV